MNEWFAGAIGIVQGLTEFIPVSSTGHMFILPAAAGEPDPGAAFSAVVQLGTLLAVLVYYRRELFVDIPVAMVRSPKSSDGRLGWFIGIATLPIVVVGLAAKDFIEGDARRLVVVASALIGFGIIMWIVDVLAKPTRDITQVRLKDALLIGLAQCLALIPGVSRSGATIVCGLLVGLRRDSAAKFSFLMSVPAIGGSGAYELYQVWPQLEGGMWRSLLIGALAAFVSGYLAIGWLMRFLTTRKLVPFAVYRVILGIVLFVLMILQIL